MDDIDLVIYHKGCPDGLAAAWVIKRRNVKASFIGKKHNEPPPDVTGKDVVIVDYSFSKDVILEMLKTCKSLLILDHHKSSEILLEGIDDEKFSFLFDMERSGSQITWDYYNPNLKGKYPRFIDYISDRDLWKWEIPNSREIGKALYSKGWYNWDKMEELTTKGEDFYNEMLLIGKTIIESEERDKSYSISQSILTVFTGSDGKEYKVLVTQCHPSLRSEVGNDLAKLCDFSATWRYDFKSNQWWISLRSSGDSDLYLPDVVKHLGAGGHPKACGFTIYGDKGENLHTYFKII